MKVSARTNNQPDQPELLNLVLVNLVLNLLQLYRGTAVPRYQVLVPVDLESSRLKSCTFVLYLCTFLYPLLFSTVALLPGYSHYAKLCFCTHATIDRTIYVLNLVLR